MTARLTWPARAFIIHHATQSPARLVVKGRDRWALEALMRAGPNGCTPIDHPGPRWSAYVLNLRKAGVQIDTLHEPNGAPFGGMHGRYVLRSNVSSIGEVRP